MDWLRSKRADWRNFVTLSGQEKSILAVSMLLLPVFGLAHRLLGLRRLQSGLNRIPPLRYAAPGSGRTALSTARSVSRVVQIAARRGPFCATCLQQSIYLRWLLARYGIDSSVRIGVRKVDGHFEAHAWVEYLGEVLNDGAAVGSRFAPFPGDLPTATASES